MASVWLECLLTRLQLRWGNGNMEKKIAEIVEEGKAQDTSSKVCALRDLRAGIFILGRCWEIPSFANLGSCSEDCAQKDERRPLYM